MQNRAGSSRVTSRKGHDSVCECQKFKNDNQINRRLVFAKRLPAGKVRASLATRVYYFAAAVVNKNLRAWIMRPERR